MRVWGATEAGPGLDQLTFLVQAKNLGLCDVLGGKKESTISAHPSVGFSLHCPGGVGSSALLLLPHNTLHIRARLCPAATPSRACIHLSIHWRHILRSLLTPIRLEPTADRFFASIRLIGDGSE